MRVIPLTPSAVEIFVRLRERAELFGSVEPEHYVFASFKPVGRFDGKDLAGKCESLDLILRDRWEAGKRHGAN